MKISKFGGYDLITNIIGRSTKRSESEPFICIVKLDSNKQELRGAFKLMYGMSPVKINTKIFGNKKYAYFYLSEEDNKKITPEQKVEKQEKLLENDSGVEEL